MKTRPELPVPTCPLPDVELLLLGLLGLGVPVPGWLTVGKSCTGSSAKGFCAAVVVNPAISRMNNRMMLSALFIVVVILIIHYHFFLYPAGILKNLVSTEAGSSTDVASVVVVPFLVWATFFSTIPFQT